MTLRVVLTVVEIALLVAVLAYFLRRLTAQLRRTGDTLAKIADGVKAIEGHCTIIGPGADALNGLLAESAGNLERAAEAAEALSR
ncbi:MAG: hypothetical protein AB1673_10415 [Actinomycetota bacterium]|jgi:hypothetical protein